MEDRPGGRLCIETYGKASLRQRAARMASTWIWDMRVAARDLRKGGWVTFACGAMLTLGIGMCAATFGVAYSLLVRPVAWPEAERLVAVLQTAPDRAKPFTVAPGVFLDWQARARGFDVLAGIWKSTGTLRFSGHAATVPVARVSAGFWRLSAMRPVLGRTFGSEEDRFGQPGVALIGAGLWNREFGGRGDVLGRTLLLDGKPRTIIGVLPGAGKVHSSETARSGSRWPRSPVPGPEAESSP